jgi:hypothetical protein
LNNSSTEKVKPKSRWSELVQNPFCISNNSSEESQPAQTPQTPVATVKPEMPDNPSCIL